MLSSAYEDAYNQLQGAALDYNKIAWAVRNLHPRHQALALEGADFHWRTLSNAMLAAARACGADVMGQGYCQLRGVPCECAYLCNVCGKPQWDGLCLLWQRGKCECRIVGVTPGARWMKVFSDDEVAKNWSACLVSNFERELRAMSSASQSLWSSGMLR